MSTGEAYSHLYMIYLSFQISYSLKNNLKNRNLKRNTPLFKRVAASAVDATVNSHSGVSPLLLMFSKMNVRKELHTEVSGNLSNCKENVLYCTYFDRLKLHSSSNSYSHMNNSPVGGAYTCSHDKQ